MGRMKEAGYEHYEISNFAKPGFRATQQQLLAGRQYLGLGPSAHSLTATAGNGTSPAILYTSEPCTKTYCPLKRRFD
jgi:oxygen-independent coproporphyrinogen-3 oxidase